MHMSIQRRDASTAFGDQEDRSEDSWGWPPARIFQSFPALCPSMPFPRRLQCEQVPRSPTRSSPGKMLFISTLLPQTGKNEKSVKTRELLLTATSAQCHVLSSMAIARYCNLVPRMWLQIKLHVTLICVNKVMSARKIPILRRNGITCDTIHFLNVGSCWCNFWPHLSVYDLKPADERVP